MPRETHRHGRMQRPLMARRDQATVAVRLEHEVLRLSRILEVLRIGTSTVRPRRRPFTLVPACFPLIGTGPFPSQWSVLTVRSGPF
jgi:hypothetical protein